MGGRDRQLAKTQRDTISSVPRDEGWESRRWEAVTSPGVARLGRENKVSLMIGGTGPEFQCYVGAGIEMDQVSVIQLSLRDVCSQNHGWLKRNEGGGKSSGKISLCSLCCV
ncbi:hypothetical protein QCA50_010199 [Cerrena zonata]|uniref:Uncharacterized protein n=1 Tax=Cerrena zonata TaxID=2478898 RepID=A0AAW0G5E8_9APHY